MESGLRETGPILSIFNFIMDIFDRSNKGRPMTSETEPV